MNREDAYSTLDAFVHHRSRTDWHGFSFEFHNYYMIVNGFVPLDVAKTLYYDSGESGQKDVRVAGHCGCPKPEEWIAWYDDNGRVLYTLQDKAEIDKLSDVMRQMLTIDSDKEIYVDNREKIGYGYITSYHVDSPGGLILLCRTIEQLARENRVSKLLLPHMRKTYTHP